MTPPRIVFRCLTRSDDFWLPPLTLNLEYAHIQQTEKSVANAKKNFFFLNDILLV